LAALAATGAALLAYRRRRAPQPPAPVPAPKRAPALLARLRDALQRDRKQSRPDSGARATPEHGKT
jgi:hypothetical protein